MDLNHLFDSWKNGSQESGTTLHMELISSELLPFANRRATDYDMSLNEPRFIQTLKDFLKVTNPHGFKTLVDFCQNIRNHLNSSLIPNHFHELCFEAWQAGHDEYLEKYWQLAYHAVIIPSARAALHHENPAGETRIAEKVKNRLAKYKKRTSMRTLQEFEKKIRYLSNLEAHRVKVTAASWEDLRDQGVLSGQEKLPAPVVNKRKAPILSKVRRDRVYRVIQEGFQSKPRPEKYSGTPWDSEIWSDYLLLVKEEDPKALRLANRMLTALLRVEDRHLWNPQVIGLLFSRLETGDLELWPHFVSLIKAGNARAKLELNARAAQFIEDRIRQRDGFRKQETREEVVDFSRTTLNRIENESDLALSSCHTLSSYYIRIFALVLFISLRDSNDLEHRAIIPELDLLLDNQTNQVKFVLINNLLSALKKHNQVLFDTYLLRNFAGLKLEEMADVLGISLQTVRKRLKDAQQWINKQL